MTRLLIADDEPLVCVGLQSMLSWEDYGIEIVGTARNGRQAAEMIEAMRPEIVITDIKMPLKTGLELAEECEFNYGKIPVFIILTSYEEFEYARRALAFKAVDYLVKLELSPESLAASIKRALSVLEELRKTESSAYLSNEGNGSRMQELRDKLFFKLINKLFESREQFNAEKEELGLEFPGGAMTVLTAEIEAGDPAKGETLQTLYTSAVRMVREKLEKRFPCFTTVLDARHFIIVFCLENQKHPGGPAPAGEDSAARRKILEEELRRTIDMVLNYFNVRIRMALGFHVDDPLRLDESYLAARQAFDETRADDPLRVFERQGFQQQLVSGVRQYIRQNLDRRLSLAEVAEHFNLSPNYLSQLFTRYTEMSFVEYITAEKISAAKKMLIAGEGPIYEIAEKLRFESAFYFSKVFKKVEGISPREFLHRIEGGKKGEGTTS